MKKVFKNSYVEKLIVLIQLIFMVVTLSCIVIGLFNIVQLVLNGSGEVFEYIKNILLILFSNTIGLISVSPLFLLGRILEKKGE